MGNFTNSRIIKLQARIVYLAQLIEVRQGDLEKRHKQRFYASLPERLAAEHAVEALETELSVVKKNYQESLFDLMVSGISHRLYVSFIERLEGPCLVWNQ